MAHLEWEGELGIIEALVFDAVRSVEHHRNATVTTHPVEKGADIADHVRVELPSVTVTGVISKAPLSAFARIGWAKDLPVPSATIQPITLPKPPVVPGIRAQASAIQGGLLQAARNLITGPSSPSVVHSMITIDSDKRVEELTALLNRLIEGKKAAPPLPGQSSFRFLRFVDEAKTYEDMVMTGFSVTRTQQKFGADVQIDLQQLKTVASEMVAIPVPSEVRASAVKPAGSTAAKKADDATANANKSAALAIAQGLFSGGGFKLP